MAAAAAAILAIVYLSWSPAGSIPRSGAPGPLEHVAAYWVAGSLAALALRDAKRRWIALGLILMAGILEVGQLWIPGRTSQLVDFAASSAGALIGIGFVGAVRGWRRRAASSRLRMADVALLAIIVAGAALTPVWIGLLLWNGWKVLARLFG